MIIEIKLAFLLFLIARIKLKTEWPRNRENFVPIHEVIEIRDKILKECSYANNIIMNFHRGEVFSLFSYYAYAFQDFKKETWNIKIINGKYIKKLIKKEDGIKFTEDLYDSDIYNVPNLFEKSCKKNRKSIFYEIFENEMKINLNCQDNNEEFQRIREKIIDIIKNFYGGWEYQWGD